MKLFYLNPGFKDIIGHHHPHQLVLNDAYSSNLIVVANKRNRIRSKQLEYKTLNLFSYNTWEYLESKNGLEIFSKDLSKLKGIIQNGDVLFMYMSDILFINPITEFLIKNGLKIKVILNLFHTGRLFSCSEGVIKALVLIIARTEGLKEKLGIELLVEGEDIQAEIERRTGTSVRVMPMFHQAVNEGALLKQDIIDKSKKKLVISYISATVERGFKQYVKLIEYIEEHDPKLFEEYNFHVRINFDYKFYKEQAKKIIKNVNVKFGRLSEQEYIDSLKNTDILLLPYKKEHFFGRTSGVLSEAIALNIPIVATKETLNAKFAQDYNIGTVFTENDINSFYEALLLAIKNTPHYKENYDSLKKVWDQYHNVSTFKNLEQCLKVGNLNLTEKEHKILDTLNRQHRSLLGTYKQLNIRHKFSELGLINRYKFEEKSSNQKILVSVGAHVGGVTSAFNSKKWREIAFEPEQNNQEAFLSKHANNENAICKAKADTDRPEDKTSFYICQKQNGIHGFKPFHHTYSSEEHELETITLRDAIKKNDVKYVSLFIVATEGSNFMALRGFDWNNFKPEMVMVEFMDERSMKNFGYTHQDIAKFMEEKDYYCFVTEWEEIKEYGIKGVRSEPHTWLGCVEYPLDHEPAWGNLIFVQNKDKNKFKKALEVYIDTLAKTSSKKDRVISKFKRLGKKLIKP